MAKRNKKNNRTSHTELPQIGSTTAHCQPTESVLNELGARGQLLVNITAFGFNNRQAVAFHINTAQRWVYRVVQFNMKDPLKGEALLNELGEEGWLLQHIYSQGANNFATAAVLCKAAGDLISEEFVSGPELVQDDSEPSFADETQGIGADVTKETLETAGY